ncbi:taurine ABC transporter substrate-binding protein [Lichenihabitans sp. Uapishka_5]|uniref:taurine ABC transporter substrate-binding protein n=1 Tax=Lichenihabitans sp. Uapishka_5 TaxID=3037302 RepID=UPI0029E80830|nr:taurine ABC transporter substrate-binding protein [Lichenihabitans sp. Uapishka_5]MDX7951535.1 taurine ABC transporter substrate-binding protein [Lichenihabitans sp. Uapishka_5]
MPSSVLRLVLLAGVVGLPTVAVAAPARPVVVAYQTGPDPVEVAIANGALARAVGRPVTFRKFNSGADIFAAIASGDVQVGYVGSSPFAAAASRGLDIKAFYVSSISGTDEALVVRNGSNIAGPADLKGKRLAAAPVSTDHYQLLATLKQNNIAEKDATVLALAQPEIVAAWHRGDLDGAFVWDPALRELKKTGTVLLTSKQVAERGAPTFNAWVATAALVKEDPAFLTAFAGEVARENASFLTDKAAWDPQSDNVKAIAKLLGGTPETQAAGLADLNLLPAAAQASEAWLGGGDKGGVARILKDTAGFLKEQRKITAVRDDYNAFVTAAFVAPLSN